MRILWITHDVLDPIFPYLMGKPSKGGSWISPLFFSLSQHKEIIMGVITPVIAGQVQKKEIDKILYYSIPIKRNSNISNMTIEIVNNYLSAINDFQPEIIHIHGIERNFAQLRKFVDERIPIICSIQGIINSYYPYLKFSSANIDLKKYQSIKNKLGRGGVSKMIKGWSDYIPIENDILKLNQYYIGRTLWDKAQLSALNSKSYYFHGEELLRPVFYSQSWNLNYCIKHRIFVSSAAYPLKGFQVVLQAVGVLKQKYPDIQLIAPLSSFTLNSSKLKDFLIAEDYARYLKAEIQRLDLVNNIIMQKKLSAEEMAIEYSKAHVFVLPSFVENSPNSLGEAMMTGTPSIVSLVGGVQSIVKDEESALFFPSGDYATLAFQIDRLFSNDNLAIKLSLKAKSIALKRHDLAETTNQYLNIYKDVQKIHHENTSYTPRT